MSSLLSACVWRTYLLKVEEGRNPALRGRPLGVRQKRILATCNYAARRRGVRKMDSVVRALQACPELVIVSGENLAPYRDASQRIFDLLRREVPAANVQRLGLDEFFVDVSAALSAEPSSATLGLTRGEPLTPSSRSTGAAASEKSANWHGHVIRAGWQPVAAAMAARDPARAQAAVTAQPTRSADTDEGGKASAATPTLQAAVGGDYGSTGDGDSDGDVSGEEESALAGSLAQSPVSRASTSMTAGDSSADAEYDCDAVENALRAATVLAARLRTVIRTQLGYTCCAGIAVNKTMAKVAGELHKPDQQTCVLPEAHDAVLAQRELKQVWKQLCVNPGRARPTKKNGNGHRHGNSGHFYEIENTANADQDVAHLIFFRSNSRQKRLETESCSSLPTLSRSSLVQPNPLALRPSDCRYQGLAAPCGPSCGQPEL